MTLSNKPSKPSGLSKGDRIAVVFEPTCDVLNRPADVRLASLLRIALRSLALKAVDVKELK